MGNLREKTTKKGEHKMTFQDLNGKKARWIIFSGDEVAYIAAKDGVELICMFEYLGDHSEIWIAEIKNGVEEARHNIRYIVSVEWEN
jgi:hypothetical protein